MENYKDEESGLPSKQSKEEVVSGEVRGLLTDLDKIEAQIEAAIEEQGSIIRSRPETDAQYARLDELASSEARLRAQENELLKKLRSLRSD